MTLADFRQRKIEKFRAQDKLCAETAAHFYNERAQCLLPATLEYDGKRYCVKHYPPTVQLVQSQSLLHRVSRLRKELAELERQL